MTMQRKNLWLAVAAIGCLSVSCKKANTSSETETPDAAESDSTVPDDADASAPSEGDAAPAAGEECTAEHEAMGHCKREEAGETPPP